MSHDNLPITINNDKYLIRRTSTKLCLHHLPSLDIVCKYYTENSFVYVNKLEIMVLSKNTITFLRPQCAPLKLVEYQQNYLDWEPIGGLAMSAMLVLYDKAFIKFYYRSTSKLEQSWSIEIVQAIESVKKSSNERFLALRVKEPSNTLFIWDMEDINKKPNQEINLKEQIRKWDFLGEEILCILTDSQFKVYFINKQTNRFFIQYYIALGSTYESFLFLSDYNSTKPDSGKRSVNTLLLYKNSSSKQPKSTLEIIELYNIDKRQRKFQYKQLLQPIELNQSSNSSLSNGIQNIIEGYEQNGGIVLVAEDPQHHPKTILVSDKGGIQRVKEYKQHIGSHIENVHIQGDSMLYHEKDKKRYVLSEIHEDNTGSQKIRRLRVIDENVKKVFLTRKYLLKVDAQNKLWIQAINSAQNSLQQPQCVDFGSAKPQSCHYIGENDHYIYFITGIRYYCLDLQKKEFKTLGFVLRNERAKLAEVRTSTSSVLYKMSEQFILMEYTINEESYKLSFRTVRSSDGNSKIVSLRNGLWVEMKLKEVILGEQNKELASFNLEKLFKTLLQEKNYFEYELYWIKHKGIALTMKNYMFFLQIVENDNGYELRMIKKGHSYLYKRFSSNALKKAGLEKIQLVDSRSLTVFTGDRIVRLGNQIQHLVTENPYSLPDTLMNRQLEMRDYYPPHHPKVIAALIQTGRYQEISNIMEKLKKWHSEQNQSLRALYNMIQISDFKINNRKQSAEKNEFGEDIIKVEDKRTPEQEKQIYEFLCSEILNEPDRFYLAENGPLVLENILSAVKFRLENSRAMDYFSELVVTKSRIHQSKEKPISMMEVAFLVHSVNKDEAMGFLRAKSNEALDWQWMQKYSIVLWNNDSQTQLLKWIEEIAMTEFRREKNPFDCLFWYILAGKKSLLVTLFKSQKYVSKEYEATFNFLQRDFSEQKNLSAAVKNSYALIDKKRYMHAMAFFLLGEKYEQCIRFAINRLKDLNLAYLIYLMTIGAKSQTAQSQSKKLNQENIQNLVSRQLIEKGDAWAKHIGWQIEKKYIASYNVLLREEDSNSWEYSPHLQGYHPCLLEFSDKVKNTVAYKRQIELINNPQSKAVTQEDFSYLQFSMDSFSNDNMQNHSESQTGSTLSHKSKEPDFYQDYQDLFEPVCEGQQLNCAKVMNQKAAKYYLRHHLPCLAMALMFEDEHQFSPSFQKQIRRAYELEQYRLTGRVSEPVAQIADGIFDIMALLQKYMVNNETEKVSFYIYSFKRRFELALKRIKVNELNPPSKYEIGEILHYAYFSEQILNKVEPEFRGKMPELEREFDSLARANNLAKIIVGICLKSYFEMNRFLVSYKNGRFCEASEQFWTQMREKYDYLSQKRKEKHQKLMDCFEESLNLHMKRKKLDIDSDSNLTMSKSSIISILISRKIFQFLYSSDKNYLGDDLLALKRRLDRVARYWCEKDYVENVRKEVEVLINEGFEVRLKLNTLPEEFGDDLRDVYEVLKMVYTFRNPEDRTIKLSENPKNEEGEVLAINIFRNKSDHFRNLALNANQGNGLEAAILFKKGMKKIEVCDSLINKDRIKGGLQLVHEDTAITGIQEVNFKEVLNRNTHPSVHSALENILNSRKLHQSEGIIKNCRSYEFKEQSYDQIRNLEPPSNVLEFNEISSIASHCYLPVFLLGSKGQISICQYSSMKPIKKLLCPELADITKMQSVQQRVCALDNSGSMGLYAFEPKQVRKPGAIFDIKKQGILDFCCLSPTLVSYVGASSVNIVDTLIHPKTQTIYKAPMNGNSAPIAINHLHNRKILVMKKDLLSVYDLRMDYPEQTISIGAKGKCMVVDQDRERVLIGRNDCKIRVIDINDSNEQTLVKVGNINDEKDKLHIDHLSLFNQSYFCSRNDGSIYHFSLD